MALKVNCPNCGPRSHTEFWFGGEVPPHHGADDGQGSQGDGHGNGHGHDALEADFARVWLKRNAAGVQAERWFHHAGCRRWLTAQRDTRTNGFHGGE
jgi:heterotetrameric sarcosine oxidase delta subunit